MSKETYARGFCKIAEAVGVDPVALAKYAQVPIGKGAYGPTRENAINQRLLDRLDDYLAKWRHSTPPVKMMVNRATMLEYPKHNMINAYLASKDPDSLKRDILGLNYE